MDASEHCRRVPQPGGENLRRKPVEVANAKAGMTHSEVREFIGNHFEEFVNKKNVQIGNVNFAAEFVDHGADVPPGMPPGLRGRFPMSLEH
jgi:hypothetical protein